MPRKIFFSSFLALSLCLSVSRTGFGQGPEGLEGHIGGGFTVPTGDMNGRLAGRGHVVVGAGYTFLPALELQAEYMYNTFGLTRGELLRINEPNGDGHVHSITIDPVLHLHLPFSRVSARAMAGIGYYHRTVEFTQPTSALTTFFDPFFGFFTAAVPANQVIGSVSRNGFGYNVGAGLDFALAGRAKLYFEARYHDAHMAHGDTEMLPLTVGLRF
jgi:opacity protein-like surface antigen